MDLELEERGKVISLAQKFDSIQENTKKPTKLKIFPPFYLEIYIFPYVDFLCSVLQLLIIDPQI